MTTKTTKTTTIDDDCDEQEDVRGNMAINSDVDDDVSIGIH